MFSAAKNRQRFDLLLLEEGEYYFEDFSGFYYPPADDKESNPHQKRFQQHQGRIRLCSRSIIFEPEDQRLPVIKLPFKNTREAPCQWRVPLISSFKSDGQYFVVDSKSVVEMRTNNEDHPYVFRKSVGDHKFSLDYVRLAEVLPRIQRLFSISKLDYGEREALLKEMILQRESEFKFDTTWLHDLTEQQKLEIRCSRVQPLIATPGITMITNSRVYFQSFNNLSPSPVEKWRLCDIAQLCTRRYVLRHTGLEFIMNDGQSFFLAFEDTESRDRVRTCILSQPGMLRLNDNSSTNMTLKWQNGVVSNYDYLMYLNHMADRTFNDITQYPVFPWILQDYTSPNLDLNDPDVYRDLSRPIGSLNPARLGMFRERMREMPEPKFLYGTHYSTPGYVLFYLVRQCPELMLRLQNGKFDAPDRLFSDIADTWKGVYSNPTDLKELIPEFYRPDSEFLQNERQLNLGVKQDGSKVGDVQLPPWAKNARDFHEKLQQALEGEYVSTHLHEWIDLIFGYKQRGEASVNADNVFFHLTYEGAVDIEAETDPMKRAAIEAQIREFGQTPKQLFTTPHPHKLATTAQDEDILSKLSPGVDAGECEEGVDTVGSVASRGGKVGWGDLSELTEAQSFRLHRDKITDVCLSADASVVYSTSLDGSMKMYNIKEKRQIRSVSFGGLGLSSSRVSPDGKNVIVGSWDNNIYIYSIDYGRVLDTLTAHDDAIGCLAFRDNILLSATWDAVILAWRMVDNVINQTPIGEYIEHESEIRCMDLDAGANRAISGSEDGQVILWDVGGQMMMRKQWAHDDEVTGIKFTPDARRFVTVGKDGFLKVFEVEGSEVWHFDAGEKLEAVDTDGIYVVAAGESGRIRIWELKEGVEKTPLKQKGGAQSGITCLAVSSDGETIVAGSADFSVNVWTRP